MRIIPVIDVMNGVVVHAKGGRRGEYLPIHSEFTSSTDPIQVARAIIKEIRPKEMYIADLDAISGAAPALDTYQAISSLGVRVLVDAGVRDGEGARKVSESGCDVVAGLETVSGPAELATIVETIGSDRIIFSMDLRNGLPVRDWLIQDSSPVRIATEALATGVSRMIVLDLARVGSGKGPGSEDLCAAITTEFPEVELIAGGGISEIEHINRLKTCGVQGVLVATALHKWSLNAQC